LRCDGSLLGEGFWLEPGPLPEANYIIFGQRSSTLLTYWSSDHDRELKLVRVQDGPFSLALDEFPSIGGVDTVAVRVTEEDKESLKGRKDSEVPLFCAGTGYAVLRCVESRGHFPMGLTSLPLLRKALGRRPGMQIVRVAFQVTCSINGAAEPKDLPRDHDSSSANG
jgi:hypothetical protein